MFSWTFSPGEPRRLAVLTVLLVLAFLGRTTRAADPFDRVPSLEEMRKRIPPGISPQQRERMLAMMKQYREQMLRGRQLALRVNPFGPGRRPPGAFPPFNGAEVEAGVLSRLGARVEKPDATLVAQLDLPKGQGLVLKEISEKSPAATVGLKAHDILLELDGKIVSNDLAEFERLLEKVKENAPVNVVVLRRGKNETLKGLKLPKAEAVRAFAPRAFQAPFPQRPPVGFPMQAPPFGGVPPGQGFGGLGGNGVLTTTFRDKDRFVTRHQEGSLIVTLTGTAGAGKAAVQEIRVQDGRENGKYARLDKVPLAYRAKVKNLIEMTEKSNARLNVEKP